MARTRTRRTAAKRAMVKVSRGPVALANASEGKDENRLDSYLIFVILNPDGSTKEPVTLTGYTTTKDGKRVNDYSYSRPFKDAPNLGSLATMAESLAKSFLKDDNDLGVKINGVIETVKGLPGIGDIAKLDILLTDLTYKQNVLDNDNKLLNYIQFGLGFAPPGGWSIGAVKITGFGFKYTHPLTPT